jgi:hypothetical protein
MCDMTHDLVAKMAKHSRRSDERSPRSSSQVRSSDEGVPLTHGRGVLRQRKPLPLAPRPCACPVRHGRRGGRAAGDCFGEELLLGPLLLGLRTCFCILIHYYCRPEAESRTRRVASTSSSTYSPANLTPLIDERSPPVRTCDFKRYKGIQELSPLGYKGPKGGAGRRSKRGRQRALQAGPASRRRKRASLYQPVVLRIANKVADAVLLSINQVG